MTRISAPRPLLAMLLWALMHLTHLAPKTASAQQLGLGVRKFHYCFFRLLRLWTRASNPLSTSDFGT